MIYTTPDYYNEFYCIADKCEDTCCAGWKIVIDKDALKKYKKIRGKLGWRMLRNVNWLEKTFRQDKEKRCAFLNDDNLCDLLLKEGEESLCKTCRQYPRHTEEFEGVREITLSVSCPEVARILIERMTPVTFISQEKEGEEEYEEFDPFLFSILEDARKTMIVILQNRTLSIRTRVGLLLEMAKALQTKIDNADMFSCFDVMEEYTREEVCKKVKKLELELEVFQKESSKQRAVLASRMFEKLHMLELLKADWAVLLARTEKILYEDKKEYESICTKFRCWMNRHPEMEVRVEQLLVYFLFTYFPGAVYDGELQNKVRMAVYLVWMIEELWMARWVENEGELSLEEIIDLVYRFSREVEHSDKNLHFAEEIWNSVKIDETSVGMIETE